MDTERVPQATGVSARETEVLAGIAEHLTNAEIADRLFISVRTVESHVSSLLRKLGVSDRRALAGLAAGAAHGVALSQPQRPAALPPAPLTPFVGRTAERAALAALLTEHRLVTAVGPGGIGKTRLALAVAAEQASQFPAGVWYVDLDLQTSIQPVRGDIPAAAASALRRTELLAPLRARPIACGFELFDACQMAAETAIAAGDLTAARQLAENVRDLPFYREEGHLATARLLVVTALAGDWDETAAFGQRFLEGWEQAGRPRAGNLNRGPYAAAAVCGLRGDDAGRAEWLTVVNTLVTPGLPISKIHHGEFFDALVLLHGGHPEEALTCWPRRLRTSVPGTTASGGRGTRRCGPRRPCSPATRLPTGPTGPGGAPPATRSPWPSWTARPRSLPGTGTGCSPRRSG